MSELPDDLLTPRQAAKIMKTHTSTIIRWVLSGKLRGYRQAGTRYLISRRDLQAMLVPVVPDPEVELPRTASQEREAAEAAKARLRLRGYRV
jgi:excisionase family DNA binding protein